ncbi:MAG: hypothetical protein WA194_00650 [Patescibacteria group bacterium]
MSSSVPESSVASELPEQNVAQITADWYKAASLVDIIASLDTLPFPPSHIPESDADGSVTKVVFARLCQQNPRLAVRYADGRLVKRSENGQGLDYYFIPKRGGFELHVHHLDANGEWVRDAYEMDAQGNVKFVAYVTQKNEGRYYADLDLADAHGHMEEPKFSDYTGSLPPAVHDPIANVGKVRQVVGRIIDAAVL